LITKDYKKILKTILAFVTFFCFTSIIALIIKLLGFDISSLPNTTKQIVSIFIYALYPAFLIFLYRKDLFTDIKKFKGKETIRKYIDISVTAYTIGVITMVVTNLILQLVLNLGVANNEEGINNLIKTLPIMMTFNACLFGPIQEELVFRKAFKDVFKNNLLFIFMSGFVFGLMHVLEFTNPLELLYIIPYSALGCAFAYIYTKTDNIWLPIILHILHNTIQVVTLLMGFGV